MSEATEWYEYGYRLDDGVEVWAGDYGTDGSWTAHDPKRGIQAVDMYDGNEVEAIYRELDRAGVAGVAIRRKVTRVEGPTETVTQADRGTCAACGERPYGHDNFECDGPGHEKARLLH